MPEITRVIPVDRERPGRKVAPEVAGDVQVAIADLRKLFGDTAFAVWWEMLCCRSDGGGLFHGTVARLAARVEKGEAAITHALRRLRDSGIVLDGGWTKLEVYNGRKLCTRKVYTRTVFGAVVDANTATVPASVIAWLQQAHGHGGARRGAGRPSDFKSRGTGAHRSAAQDVHPSPVELQPVLHTMHFKSEGVEGSAGFQDAGPIESSSKSKPAPCDAFGIDARRSVVRGSVLGSLPRTEGPNLRALGSPRAAPPPISLADVIPPYPSTSLIRPAQLPPPPMIPDDLSDHGCARMLVSTYNACIRKRFGQRSSVLASDKSLRGSPIYPRLIAAARLLRDKNIAPAAWLAFWLDNRDRERTDIPPLRVYFTTGFITRERRWVFRTACPHYGNRVEFGPAHKELIDLYLAMQLAIRAELPETINDVERIVARHFPPGRWGLLLDDAQKEARAKQVAYDNALAQGEFLW